MSIGIQICRCLSVSCFLRYIRSSGGFAKWLLRRAALSLCIVLLISGNQWEYGGINVAKTFGSDDHHDLGSSPQALVHPE